MLLDNLLGSWDPVKKKYEKLAYIMDVMEAGVGLGGGPVKGVNFTARCRDICAQVTELLEGRPSENVMFATVLALYRVKPQVIKIIEEADPHTGTYYIFDLCNC